jgi:alkylated DNA nucleotide flippase Atl1
MILQMRLSAILQSRYEEKKEMESRVVKIFMRLQKGKSITRADIVEIGRDARKAGAIVAQSGPDPTTPDQNDFIA